MRGFGWGTRQRVVGPVEKAALEALRVVERRLTELVRSYNRPTGAAEEMAALREKLPALRVACAEAKKTEAAARKAEREAKIDRKPRDECQICEGTQALDGRGCMVHHGYKRPGHGWIVGDCMGVARLPFPATDALVEYRDATARFQAQCEKSLAELPARNESGSRCGGRTATTAKRGSRASGRGRSRT